MLENRSARSVSRGGKGVRWTGPYLGGGMVSALAPLTISDKAEWDDFGRGDLEGVSDCECFDGVSFEGREIGGL